MAKDYYHRREVEPMDYSEEETVDTAICSVDDNYLQSNDSTIRSSESDDCNVKVVVRVREFVKREIERNAKCIVKMDEGRRTTTLLASTHDGSGNSKGPSARRQLEDKAFIFDQSFWSHNPQDKYYADQEAVYKAFGEEFLDHNFNGYHTCILAYGQTGSGKSFTMMGTEQEPGLMPRTCRGLFQRIENNPAPNTTYSVHASYFEVYNERVRDLLVPRTNIAYYLKIRESQSDGVYVQGLTEAAVKSYEDIAMLMRMGDMNRSTASTKMNDRSSRSHAVFTLHLKQIQHSLTSDETLERSARMRLVDLAGSERAKATEATGQRLVEGGKINKSLTTLGRVISALADPRRQGKHGCNDIVPYRDSVLTWILKDCLGGNSKTAMIACISPCDYDETLSTLRYADQAKRIQTRATVNVDAVSAAERDAQIAVMTETIRKLQRAINATRVRREREEAGELEDYQKQVQKMQRLMEESRDIGEAKLKALTADADKLKCENLKLQGEIGSLKRHLTLLVEELKNPIVLPREWAENAKVPCTVKHVKNGIEVNKRRLESAKKIEGFCGWERDKHDIEGLINEARRLSSAFDINVGIEQTPEVKEDIKESEKGEESDNEDWIDETETDNEYNIQEETAIFLTEIAKIRDQIRKDQEKLTYPTHQRTNVMVPIDAEDIDI